MTFQNTADLAIDEQYKERLSACLYTESLGKPGDPLADRILSSASYYGVTLFGPVVASAPGFGEKFATGGQEAVTDADLLSAVQASWDRMAGLMTPATP